MEKPINQNTENSAKQNLIAVILSLGHESYKKASMDALYTHILSNSRVVSAYDMSCIVDMRSGKPKIVGVMGSDRVNRNTEYCSSVEILVTSFQKLEKTIEISRESLLEKKSNDKTLGVFDKFVTENPKRKIFLIPLNQPSSLILNENSFLWYVEYYDDKKAEEIKRLSLLASHYSEAIWYFLKSGSSSIISGVSGKYSFFKSRAFFSYLALFIVLMLFLVRIGQNVSGEFEIIPKERTICYAQYPGMIDEIRFKNGENVKKGDIILKYNNEELLYSLEQAQNKYQETSAKLDLIRQTAFKDTKEIGNIKLLSIEQNIDKIEIEKIKWQLEKSVMKADASGIVIIEDDFRLRGRSVNPGEKLFEIVQPGAVLGEVFVNEADSSVVANLKSVTLYLHTKPEIPINGKIISVSPIPILTDNKQFCYVIRLEINNPDSNLIYGMRGVARVTGDRVTLAYYLFRNAILWWRKI